MTFTKKESTFLQVFLYMYIQQIYTNCLAEAAYYIESDGEAAIIDPLRDIDAYLDLSKERNASIKYVFETHFHADFVSGHSDLKNATGAEIVYGPGAEASYEITAANDDQVFNLGSIKIKVLHTPGHTLESACFLVLDEEGKEHSIFTGDTLFVGDVGRPDLAVSSSISSTDLASMLYSSITEKLKPLPEGTIMYPGHGPGSQCGKSLGPEIESTLGAQLNGVNSVINQTREEFVEMVTSGLNTPPQYFPKNAGINKSGTNKSVDAILKDSLQPLSLDMFKAEHAVENTVILDTRPAVIFPMGFVPNSINIGLEGFFAVWVGTLIEDLNTRILLITEAGKEKDSITRLARVGYDNVIGYLNGGVEAWKGAEFPIEKLENVCPASFKQSHESFNVLDVRTAAEYANGHLSNALNIPLAELESRLSELNKNETYYVHCKSGYRSVIACSVLKKNGIKSAVNIKKGYDALMSDNGCCSSKK